MHTYVIIFLSEVEIPKTIANLLNRISSIEATQVRW